MVTVTVRIEYEREYQSEEEAIADNDDFLKECNSTEISGELYSMEKDGVEWNGET